MDKMVEVLKASSEIRYLSDEGFERLEQILAEPGEPTPALIELMRGQLKVDEVPDGF
jgi:hypothetical protein